MTENKEKSAAQETWKVRKAAPEPARTSGWLDILRRRPPPSTYQRCLAVHIHFASPRSTLG